MRRGQREREVTDPQLSGMNSAHPLFVLYML